MPTATEAEIEIPQDPPPIPQLPASGPKRVPTVRAFAERILAKFGPAGSLLLASELEELVDDRRAGA
jgi:hypothetical protein